MAEISSTYITYAARWETGDRAGKLRQKTFEVTITVPKTDATAYGDKTNTISATTLGLTVIDEVRSMVESNADLAIIAGPNATGSLLLTYEPTVASTIAPLAIAAKVKRVDSNTANTFQFLVSGH